MPVAAVAALAFGNLMLHLIANGLYGYHRDELYYYLASGNQPAFGYVDFPPLTPLLAGVDALLFGNSPWLLRPCQQSSARVWSSLSR